MSTTHPAGHRPGFVDTFGRALPASTGQERYHLRAFSLFVIVKRIRAEKKRYDSQLQELYSWKKTQVSLLRDMEERLDVFRNVPPCAQETASKNIAIMKLDLAKRRIKTELERPSNLETKNFYIYQTLADVIDKYAEFVHPGLLDRMFRKLPQGKLPRETRDMIYEYVLPLETTIFFWTDTDKTGFSLCSSREGIYGPISCPCPMISITYPLVDEILESFYRRTTFSINTYGSPTGLLEQLFENHPWPPNANVLPRNFIRRINIMIRLLRDADFEKAIGDLRKLHGLVALDVTASLSKYYYDSTLGLKYLDLLQPLLRELQQKGHDIRIID